MMNKTAAFLLVAVPFLLPHGLAGEENADDTDWYHLFPLKVDGKYGYMDITGKLAIKPKFETAHFFFDAVAWVEYKGRPAVINHKGRILFAGKHNKYAMFDSFSEGLSRIGTDEKTGYINKKGKLVIPIKYRCASKFSEGFAAVKNSYDGRYYYINPKGKRVAKAVFGLADPFRDGLALAKKGPDSGYGFINYKCVFTIKPNFKLAHGFSEGLAAVFQDDKWGFIDKTGKFSIEPAFELAGDFSGGLAVVTVDGKNGKYAFIDKSGAIAFVFHCDKAYDFFDGLAAFCIDGKYGVINRKGEVVIEPKHDALRTFRGLVSIAGEYYDAKGKRVRVRK